jgi:hypothetical protein
MKQKHLLGDRWAMALSEQHLVEVIYAATYSINERMAKRKLRGSGSF